MNDIDYAAAPLHQANEAPVSTELREHASQNLETIKQLINEARESGSLSKEDEQVLREWLAQDVQAPAAEANHYDEERQRILAASAVNNAVGGVHVAEDYSVMTPAEHQNELAFRQEHGHASGEVGTSV